MSDLLIENVVVSCPTCEAVNKSVRTIEIKENKLVIPNRKCKCIECNTYFIHKSNVVLGICKN